MGTPLDLLNGLVGSNTPGIAYVHFDPQRVRLEHYAGSMDVATGRAVEATTSFHGFSVTKTLTALAVMQQVQDRALDLDAPVRELLPSMPYDGPITVRHLLGHTAGLPNPLPLRWVHDPHDGPSFDRDRFFAGVFRRNPRTRHAPGERFAYSNLGYVLLGQLLERITGTRYEALIQQRVLAPAGITPHDLTFSYPTDGRHATGHLRTPSLTALLLPLLVDTGKLLGKRTGRWRAFRPFLLNGTPYGGSLGTATGYRLYLQALLHDGLLLTPALRDILFTGTRTTAGGLTGMALGWWTGNLNGLRYVAHAGGGGGYYAELRLYPDQGLGSVVLLNRTGLKDERLLDRLDARVIGA